MFVDGFGDFELFGEKMDELFVEYVDLCLEFFELCVDYEFFFVVVVVGCMVFWRYVVKKVWFSCFSLW